MPKKIVCKGSDFTLGGDDGSGERLRRAEDETSYSGSGTSRRVRIISSNEKKHSSKLHYRRRNEPKAWPFNCLEKGDEKPDLTDKEDTIDEWSILPTNFSFGSLPNGAELISPESEENHERKNQTELNLLIKDERTSDYESDYVLRDYATDDADNLSISDSTEDDLAEDDARKFDSYTETDSATQFDHNTIYSNNGLSYLCETTKVVRTIGTQNVDEKEIEDDVHSMNMVSIDQGIFPEECAIIRSQGGEDFLSTPNGPISATKQCEINTITDDTVEIGDAVQKDDYSKRKDKTSDAAPAVPEFGVICSKDENKILSNKPCGKPLLTLFYSEDINNYDRGDTQLNNLTVKVQERGTLTRRGTTECINMCARSNTAHTATSDTFNSHSKANSEILQSVCSSETFFLNKENSGLSEDEIMKRNLVYELFVLEKNYFEDLSTVCHVFDQVCENNSADQKTNNEAYNSGINLLTDIFSYIKVIRDTSFGFLKSLINSKTINNDTIDNLGQLLLDIYPSFAIYNSYAKLQASFFYKFDKLRKEIPIFSKFVADMERDKGLRRLNLKNFVLMPSTHLGRYLLIIPKIVSHCDKDSKDRLDLSKAEQKIKEILSAIDSTINEEVSFYELSSLKKRIISKIGLMQFAPIRHYRHDNIVEKGNLMYRVRRNTYIPVDVFLFWDYMVIAEKKSGRMGSGNFCFKIIHVALFKSLQEFSDLTSKAFRLSASQDDFRACSAEPPGSVRPSDYHALPSRRSDLKYEGGPILHNGREIKLEGSSRKLSFISRLGLFTGFETSGSDPNINIRKKIPRHFCIDSISTKPNNDTDSHLFYAEDGKAFDKWISAINRVIDIQKNKKKDLYLCPVSTVSNNTASHVLSYASSSEYMYIGLSNGIQICKKRNSLDTSSFQEKNMATDKDNNTNMNESALNGSNKTYSSAIKCHNLQNVTQLAVIEQFNIILFVSNKVLFTCSLNSLGYDECVLKSIDSKSVQKISTGITSFRVTKMKTVVQVVMIESGFHSSKIKICILKNSVVPTISKKIGAKMGIRHSNIVDVDKLKKFYVPGQINAIEVLGTKILINSRKKYIGIIDTQTVKTKEYPVSIDDNFLESILRNNHTKPVELLRLSSNSLVICYTTFAVFIDSSGILIKKKDPIYWAGNPLSFAVKKVDGIPYLIAIGNRFIELWCLKTNTLDQLIHFNDPRPISKNVDELVIVSDENESNMDEILLYKLVAKEDQVLAEARPAEQISIPASE